MVRATFLIAVSAIVLLGLVIQSNANFYSMRGAVGTYFQEQRKKGKTRQLFDKTSVVPRYKKRSHDLPKTPDFALVRHPPPVLWSLPGSGSTWVRALLDAATGGSSGSMYNDQSLEELGFTGEMQCAGNMTVIKAHPETFPFSSLFGQTLEEGLAQALHEFRTFENRILPASSIAGIDKCYRGLHPKGKEGPQLAFDSAIILMRDPGAALFSQWQFKLASRSKTPRSENEAHVSRIRRRNFNVGKWRRFALGKGVESHRQAYIDYTHALMTLGTSNVVLVNFEDLTSNEATVRLAALRKMVNFITDPGSVPDSRLRDAFASSAMVARRRPARTYEVGRKEALNNHLEQLIQNAVIQGRGGSDATGTNQSAFELLRDIASISRRQ